MPRIKVRDAQSGQVVVLDQIREPLFDTLELDENTTLNETKDFFSSVQGKKPFETNLRQNNFLEQAVSFRIQGISLDAHSVADTVATANGLFLAKFMEHSSLRLRIGEKIYWNGPMRYATGRINMIHELDGAAAASIFSYQQYGNSAVAGIILAGKDSIDIPPLQSFRMEMTTSNLPAGIVVKANNPIKFVLGLKGLLRRPVQ